MRGPLIFAWLLCVALGAAESSRVDQLIADLAESIPADELAEPGSVAFPEKVAELVAAAPQLDLTATEQVDLRIRLGEAWLASGKGARAAAVFREVLAAGGPSAGRRHRIGLGLVRAWTLSWEAAAADDEAREALGDPVAYLAELGEFDARVRARAWCVLGQVRSREAQAAEAGDSAFERALALVAGEETRERVPIYALIIDAMEQAEVNPQAIEAWLLARKDDPAAQQVLESLLTSAQKLVGREAPPLSAPRIDGEEGEVAVADYAAAEQPVLVYFFASWCDRCAQLSPVLARLAATDDLEILGVSLDTRDSATKLPAYLAEHGITFPVVGDRLGWDSEADDNYYVAAIPTLVLVGADGRVADADLIDHAGPDATAVRVRRAVAALEEDPAAGGEGPVIP